MFLSRPCEIGGVIRALDDINVSPLPDVIVLVRPLLQITLPLALKLGRELWIVAPVQLDDANERVIRKPEARFDWRVLALRVPRHPQFGVPIRAFLAQRRNQRRPRFVRDRLSLIDPTQQNASFRLDAVNALIQTGKRKLDAAIATLDVLLAYLVVRSQERLFLDRSLELFERRISQRAHVLTGAQDDSCDTLHAELVTPDGGHLGEAARLARSATAVGTANVSRPNE